MTALRSPQILIFLLLCVSTVWGQGLYPGDAVVTRKSTPGRSETLRVIAPQGLGFLHANSYLRTVMTVIPQRRILTTTDFGGQEVAAVAIDDATGDIYAGVAGGRYNPLQTAPAEIWRIPPAGQPVLFAVLPGQWGVGALVIDKSTCNLYASDLDSGIIHRISLLSPGVTSSFDPLGPDIPDSAMAPLGERVLALALNSAEGRLYYSIHSEDSGWTVGPNEVRSVALDANGEFLPPTDTLEFASPPLLAGYSMPVFDLEFNQGGTQLLLAEGGYDSAGPGTPSGESRTLSYSGASGAWTRDPTFLGAAPAVPANSAENGTFEIGSLPAGRNGCGGVDFAYDYMVGTSPATDESFILTTGTLLLTPGGTSSSIDGVSYLPASGGNPAVSLAVDLDGIAQVAELGLGDVEVYRPWTASVGFSLIGNRVWDDLNGNGLQDMGEPGLANIQVELLPQVGPTPLQTALTDSQGMFTFTVAPGTYRLRFLAPSGYALVPQRAGTDNTINSSANPTTGESDPITVTSCVSTLDWDAGMVTAAPSTIGDLIWWDLNGDGIQDTGEPGLSGVSVSLVDSATNTVLSTNSTDLLGMYSLQASPGSYYLTLTPPSGFILSPTNQGGNPDTDSDFDPVTLQTAIFTVSSGTTINNLDGGLALGTDSAVGNRIWVDINCDGVQDSAEPGLGGVMITAYDIAAPTIPIETRVTDTNGVYRFILSPGTYILEITVPGSYQLAPSLQGPDPDLDSDFDPLTLRTAPATVVAGQLIENMDGGLCPCAGLQASSTLLGPGCSAGPAPTLWTTPPVIGQTMHVEINGGVPGSSFWVMASAAPVFTFVHPQTSCQIYVDMFNASNLYDVYEGTLDSNGDWMLDLPLPNEPGAIGTQLIIQARVLTGSGILGGFDVTNGVLLQFGCP